ncbi:MAG: dihydrofolate reductase family protein [Nitrososphaerota archaeon]
MRKVVGGLFTSLDGVVEAEILPQPQAEEWNPFYADMQDFMVEAINEQDAVLLGRGTYQAWAAFWPTAPAELPFARFINPVPKYVVSTTLSNVEAWQPTTVLTGDIPQTIAQLQQQPGKNIGVHGSLTLIRSLLEWGLLDELNLAVMPVMLGGGRRLLNDGDSPKKLQLASSKSTKSGGLFLTYQLARP